MRRRGLLAVAGALIVPQPAAAARPLEIVTTIAQIADLVGRIGGERAKVRPLMGEGVDPHTYRQTRADVLAMQRADAVFANGLHLEAQLEELLAALARTKPVVLLAERLPRDRLLANEQFESRFDPHVWMDVALWRELVPIVRDELARLDPAGDPAVRARAAAYEQELAGLEAYVRRSLGTVPPEQRVVISAHDAFN